MFEKSRDCWKKQRVCIAQTEFSNFRRETHGRSRRSGATRKKVVKNYWPRRLESVRLTVAQLNYLIGCVVRGSPGRAVAAGANNSASKNKQSVAYRKKVEQLQGVGAGWASRFGRGGGELTEIEGMQRDEERAEFTYVCCIKLTRRKPTRCARCAESRTGWEFECLLLQQ